MNGIATTRAQQARAQTNSILTNLTDDLRALRGRNLPHWVYLRKASALYADAAQAIQEWIDWAKRG